MSTLFNLEFGKSFLIAHLEKKTGINDKIWRQILTDYGEIKKSLAFAMHASFSNFKIINNIYLPQKNFNLSNNPII